MTDAFGRYRAVVRRCSREITAPTRAVPSLAGGDLLEGEAAERGGRHVPLTLTPARRLAPSALARALSRRIDFARSGRVVPSTPAGAPARSSPTSTSEASLDRGGSHFACCRPRTRRARRTSGRERWACFRFAAARCDDGGDPGGKGASGTAPAERTPAPTQPPSSKFAAAPPAEQSPEPSQMTLPGIGSWSADAVFSKASQDAACVSDVASLYLRQHRLDDLVAQAVPEGYGLRYAGTSARRLPRPLRLRRWWIPLQVARTPVGSMSYTGGEGRRWGAPTRPLWTSGPGRCDTADAVHVVVVEEEVPGELQGAGSGRADLMGQGGGPVIDEEAG